MDLSDHSTLFHFGPREVADVFEFCWCLAFILHRRVLTCICRCRDQQQLSNVFSSQYSSNILYTIISVFNAVLSECSKDMGILCWFVLPLTCQHPCLWNTESVEDGPLKPSHYITCYQLTCLPVECYKQVFLEHSTAFPVFCCPLSQHFLNMLLALNSEYAYIYKNLWSWGVFSLFSIGYMSKKEWKKDCIKFYTGLQVVN